MSLLEVLKEKGNDIIDEKGDSYLDRLVNEGRKAVDEAVADDDPIMADGAEAAHKALDIFSANKKHFKRLTKVGLSYVLAHWEDGDEAEARRRFLAGKATFAERRAAMHAAGDAVAAVRKEREEAWDAVAHVFGQIGQIGVKFLVRAAVATI